MFEEQYKIHFQDDEALAEGHSPRHHHDAVARRSIDSSMDATVRGGDGQISPAPSSLPSPNYSPPPTAPPKPALTSTWAGSQPPLLLSAVVHSGKTLLAGPPSTVKRSELGSLVHLASLGNGSNSRSASSGASGSRPQLSLPTDPNFTTNDLLAALSRLQQQQQDQQQDFQQDPRLLPAYSAPSVGSDFPTSLLLLRTPSSPHNPHGTEPAAAAERPTGAERLLPLSLLNSPTAAALSAAAAAAAHTAGTSAAATSGTGPGPLFVERPATGIAAAAGGEGSGQASAPSERVSLNRRGAVPSSLELSGRPMLASREARTPLGGAASASSAALAGLPSSSGFVRAPARLGTSPGKSRQPAASTFQPFSEQPRDLLALLPLQHPAPPLLALLPGSRQPRSVSPGASQPPHAPHGPGGSPTSPRVAPLPPSATHLLSHAAAAAISASADPLSLLIPSVSPPRPAYYNTTSVAFTPLAASQRPSTRQRGVAGPLAGTAAGPSLAGRLGVRRPQPPASTAAPSPPSPHPVRAGGGGGGGAASSPGLTPEPSELGGGRGGGGLGAESSATAAVSAMAGSGLVLGAARVASLAPTLTVLERLLPSKPAPTHLVLHTQQLRYAPGGTASGEEEGRLEEDEEAAFAEGSPSPVLGRIPAISPRSQHSPHPPKPPRDQDPRQRYGSWTPEPWHAQHRQEGGLEEGGLSGEASSGTAGTGSSGALPSVPRFTPLPQDPHAHVHMVSLAPHPHPHAHHPYTHPQPPSQPLPIFASWGPTSPQYAQRNLRSSPVPPKRAPSRSSTRSPVRQKPVSDALAASLLVRASSPAPLGGGGGAAAAARALPGPNTAPAALQGAEANRASGQVELVGEEGARREEAAGGGPDADPLAGELVAASSRGETDANGAAVKAEGSSGALAEGDGDGGAGGEGATLRAQGSLAPRRLVPYSAAETPLFAPSGVPGRPLRAPSSSVAAAAATGVGRLSASFSHSRHVVEPPAAGVGLRRSADNAPPNGPLGPQGTGQADAGSGAGSFAGPRGQALNSRASSLARAPFSLRRTAYNDWVEGELSAAAGAKGLEGAGAGGGGGGTGAVITGGLEGKAMARRRRLQERGTPASVYLKPSFPKPLLGGDVLHVL